MIQTCVCFSPHPVMWARVRRLSRLEWGVSGSHMTNFQTEESHTIAPSINVHPSDASRAPPEHDTGGGTVRRAWLWLTTGARLVATAVCVSAVVSIVLAWTFFSGLLYRDRAEEGRTISQRILDLTALQTGSRSALGCLDVSIGDPLEEICERTIFASPESVAEANAFVAARVSVLEDAVAYANRVHSHYAGVIVALRQAVENDQFGIVAHVLAARYGCSAAQCSAFALLNDSSKVIANFNARTFENLITRYAPSWQAQAGAAVLALPSQGPAVAAPIPGPSANLHPAGTPPRGLYVPPASSIPAVSIMTDEPRATAAAPTTAPASPPHPVAVPRPNPRTQPSTPVPAPVQPSPDTPNPG